MGRLLSAVSIDPDTPDVLYRSGVAIYADTEFGPIYGHAGWVPEYLSSLRHYADYNIMVAFQINTDIGAVGNSTHLVPALETALARLFIETAAGE